MTLSPERTGTVRPVLARDLPALTALLATDPAVHCFLDARVRAGGADPWRLGGDLWGYFAGEALESAVYAGANLVPVATTPRSRAAFADRLRRSARRCSSLVGPAEEVLDLWRLLEPAWGPAREVRARQPFLLLDRPPALGPDPLVRHVRPDELDTLMPAAIAMFTEEVGVSPVAGGTGHAYRARVAELIGAGRALARFDAEGVVFKAEIGTATPDACQIQGVWVRPSLRGRGISEPAMAAVAEIAQASIAPVVTLYVNDYNTAARKLYAAVGFREHATFATILL